MYGIQNIDSYTPLMAGGKVGGSLGKAPEAAGSSFTGIFQNALRDVADAEAQKNNDTYNLALGDIDDLTALMTNAERAQISFQLLVQMRNKILDSYSEIMRMNI